MASRRFLLNIFEIMYTCNDQTPI